MVECFGLRRSVLESGPGGLQKKVRTESTFEPRVSKGSFKGDMGPSKAHLGLYCQLGKETVDFGKRTMKPEQGPFNDDRNLARASFQVPSSFPGVCRLFQDFKELPDPRNAPRPRQPLTCAGYYLDPKSIQNYRCVGCFWWCWVHKAPFTWDPICSYKL